MWRRFKEWLSRLLSNDIGIDLGTANTLVYLRGKGIVIDEPSVVAVNRKTGRVVAVGEGAKKMLGRTPEHIEAVRPLVDGVISDFEVTEEMLAYLINKAQKNHPKPLGPRVVVGVPTGITNVEQRAVRDAARNAGAREVHIVEEPVAAALGIRLPIHESAGNMIIDIGGGTSDIALLSLDGVVVSRNLKIAGDRLNQDIISYLRDKHKILVGERTAEDAKILLASVERVGNPEVVTVRGRDMATGLPRAFELNDDDIRLAIGSSIQALLETIREVMEGAPPEILSDIMRRGIHVVGGGAQIKGLGDFLSDWLGVPVKVDEDPLTAVARGTGRALEDIEYYRGLFINDEDSLPPTA